MVFKKLVFITLFIMTLLVMNLVSAQWTETGIVFDPIARAYYPSVIYDLNQFSLHGSTNYYKMWYGTNNQDTALAVSDDGIVWTDVGVVMANGYHSHVIYDEAGFGGGIFYKMWYWDASMNYIISDLRYTESADGVTWVNDQAITQDPVYLGGVSVVDNTLATNWNRGTYGPIDVFYNPAGAVAYDDIVIWNNRYVMYYDGTTGSTEEIGLAYSVDGLEWRGYGNVLTYGIAGEWDDSHVAFGTIYQRNGNWEMVYSGGSGNVNQGIGLASSFDRIAWTRDPLNPLMHISDGMAYRDERTYTPSVVCDSLGFSGNGDSAECKMWFACRAGGNYAICYATHDFSSDDDGDGVDNADDLCPGSLAGEPVDADGCDAFQFCLQYSCGFGCFYADFLGDEPGELFPMDCVVVVVESGDNLFPRCVPLSCPIPPECEDDEDCDEGEECIDGVCEGE